MSIQVLRIKGVKRYRFNLFRHINGNRVRATKLLAAGITESEAHEFDKNETARIIAQAYGIRKRDSLEEAVKIYTNERVPKLKSGLSVINDLSHLEPYIRGKTYADLSAISREYGRTPLSPATIRKRLTILRAACEYAYKVHQIGDRENINRMVLPTVRNSRQIYLDRKRVIQIALQMDRPWRGIALIAFYSGLRLGEILSAKHRNGAFEIRDSKNGEPRRIPIHPKCAVYVRKLTAVRGDTTSKKFLEAARAAGVEARFHDLRHSAASEMINSGIDLYTVGAVLGHKSAVSTKRYAHLAQDKLIEAVGRIGRKSHNAGKEKAPIKGLSD